MKTEYYQDTAMGQDVRNFLADWPLAQRSRDSYEETLGWMCEQFRTTTLEDLVTPDGVRNLRTWLAEKAQEKGWKPSTLRQRMAAIRTFLDWAEGEELIAHSPSRKLRPPKVRGGTNRRAYPPSMIDHIRNRQPTLREKIAVQLVGDLGLRKDELRLLKLEDMSVEDETVEVLHGKGGTQRVLPMTERIRDDFKKLLWTKPDHVYLLYPQGNPSNPFSLGGIHYWWLRCLERAGVEKILLHEMRHSAATNLLASSGQLQASQELLGHQNLATTSTYLHSNATLLRDAVRTRGEDAA
jgi:site-specific recombinase XerD